MGLPGVKLQAISGRPERLITVNLRERLYETLFGLQARCNGPVLPIYNRQLTNIANGYLDWNHIDQSRRSIGRQPRVGGLHRGQRGPVEADALALVARGSACRDPSTLCRTRG